MRRFIPTTLLAVSAALGAPPAPVDAQANGAIVFVNARPPRELQGNIRGWAAGHRVTAYNEDTSAHAWRVQFMVFCSRPPRARDVTLSFFKLEGRTRRYITNESITLSSPDEAVFFHSTMLHRSPDEFEPMENYEVTVAVADARGQTVIARGRIGLVGVVERRSGVVDFTADGGPVAR